MVRRQRRSSALAPPGVGASGRDSGAGEEGPAGLTAGWRGAGRGGTLHDHAARLLTMKVKRWSLLLKSFLMKQPFHLHIPCIVSLPVS